MSAISTPGTFGRDCVAEGLRLILPPHGGEYEKEPRDDECASAEYSYRAGDRPDDPLARLTLSGTLGDALHAVSWGSMHNIFLIFVHLKALWAIIETALLIMFEWRLNLILVFIGVKALLPDVQSVLIKFPIVVKMFAL